MYIHIYVYLEDFVERMISGCLLGLTKAFNNFSVYISFLFHCILPLSSLLIAINSFLLSYTGQ